MNATSRKRQALEVSGAAAVVIVAAFLPWGEIDFRQAAVPPGGGISDGFNQLIAGLGTVPVTVWNGHATIGGLKLPNVLVLLAAVLAALLAWLRTASIVNIPSGILIALAAYGLAHSGYVLVGLVMSEEGSVDLGVFMTTGGFVWMLIALVRRERTKEAGTETE